MSDHIRFAMDLRYQSPHRPWGFYGMKDGILIRSPRQPGHVPDWDFYDNQDRYKIIQEQVEHKTVGTRSIAKMQHNCFASVLKLCICMG